MTFFGPSMTEKTVVEARERKISGGSRLRWVVGVSDARFSRTRTRVGARRWALTEPGSNLVHDTYYVDPDAAGCSTCR